MKIGKLILQALAGLVTAAVLALAVSTWGLTGEGDGLVSFGTLRLTVSGIGAGAALLVTLAFADGWIGERKRRGGSAFPGTLLNGLGFGVLPGAAVWKIFEQITFLRAGKPLEEGMPTLPFVTENGLYQPSRLEMILALAAFAGVLIWLALRKRELPENGDLTGVSLTLWAAVRMLTEGFRAPEAALFGVRLLALYLAAGILALCLLFWTRRALRTKENTGYALACVPVFCTAAAVIILQSLGILRVNPAADPAIRLACALLAMKAVICMGRVGRP